jgi:AcrR family transcriptional regulator
MTPRPRKVSDEQVFAATYRAMTRLGPRELTLSAIASEAGVTPGALVQRFGSKRELMLKLSEGAASSTGEFMTGLLAKHDSPLEALRAYAGCMAGLAESPAAFVRNVAYLQIDLTDPDFRRQLEAQARATRAGLQTLIEAAVEARELVRRTDAARLARTVEAMLSGSMMTWAFYTEGTAADWMRADVEAVLWPYIRKKKRKRP